MPGPAFSDRLQNAGAIGPLANQSSFLAEKIIKFKAAECIKNGIFMKNHCRNVLSKRSVPYDDRLWKLGGIFDGDILRGFFQMRCAES